MRAVLAVVLALLVLGWLLQAWDETGSGDDISEAAGAGTSREAADFSGPILQGGRAAPEPEVAGRKSRPPQSDAELPATPPGRMRLVGTFRDESGEGVRARSLNVELERDGGVEKLVMRGTQAEGNFEYWFALAEVGGTVRLRAFISGFVPVVRTFPARPGTSQRLDIVFARGAVLRGRVVDEIGSPVAAVRVSIAAGAGTAAKGPRRGGMKNVATSDEQGLFALQGVPSGLCTVGGSSQLRSFGSFRMGLCWRLAPDQEVRAGEALQSVTAHRIASLAGSVLDAWSLQLLRSGHVQARLTLEDGRTLNATSRIVSGWYRLSWVLPPGGELHGCSLAIEFSVRGYESSTLRTPDFESAGATPDMVLLDPLDEPELGSAWLQVVDDEGRAVELDLRVRRSLGDARPLVGSLPDVVLSQVQVGHLFRVPARVRALGKGRLELRGPVGTCRFQIAPKWRMGGLAGWTGEVALDPGPEKWTTVRLPPMAVLEIPAARPEALKEVRLTMNRADPWGVDAGNLTLPPGRIRLAVKPGTWHVRVGDASEEAWQVLKLAAGTTTLLKLP